MEDDVKNEINVENRTVFNLENLGCIKFFTFVYCFGHIGIFTIKTIKTIAS